MKHQNVIRFSVTGVTAALLLAGAGRDLRCQRARGGYYMSMTNGYKPVVVDGFGGVCAVTFAGRPRLRD